MSKTNQYGLPSLRGEDNQLVPVDHTFEWNGEQVRIKLLPPTIRQVTEYEKLGTDVDVDRLEEIVDQHIVEPDMPASEMSMHEINCYIYGIQDHGAGGGEADLMEQVRNELESRDSGNED